MKNHLVAALCILALGTGMGCKKNSEEPAKPAATSSTNMASPAAPAASAAPAPSASSGAVNGSSAETTSKMAAADWALKQDEIKHDANGQWAIQATASSTYGDAQGAASYSANQVTGTPNVDNYGDNGNAWAPKTEDAGIEWVDLKYPKPVQATEVRVRESCGSGAVIKVEVFDEQGVAHSVWQGNDPTTELNYLMVKFPKTTFKTDRVKVTLATNVIPGWNEVDAVQLVGTSE
jgi:hypothetical protein